MRAHSVAPRSAMSSVRAIAAVAAVIAAGCGVTACQAAPAEDIVGKQWQITAVFDDPTLPHAIPSDIEAPRITLGQTTYAFSDACGDETGDVRWIDQSVEIKAPTQTRRADCSPQEKTYGQRFRDIMAGQSVYSEDDNGLRLRELRQTDGNADQHRGFTAVSVAAGGSADER